MTARAIYIWTLFVATLILLLIGALVNPMGASLACPDWYFVPTCNGEFFPIMEGGVLYEHGHRLWATLVGLQTIGLVIFGIRSKNSDPRFLKNSVVALGMVIVQGAFGGVTVLLGLNAWLSTAHLVLGNGFMLWILYMAMAERKQKVCFTINKRQQVWLAHALAMVFIQILLGGLMRHFGAGMACGNDVIACGPSFWPEWNLGKLHMLHRYFGYATFFVGIAACLMLFVGQKSTKCRSVFLLPIVLLVLQVLLGILTIATLRHVHVVASHTFLAALCLVVFFALFQVSARATRTQNQSAGH